MAKLRKHHDKSTRCAALQQQIEEGVIMAGEGLGGEEFIDKYSWWLASENLCI